jgi:predicted PurR-regulated permease PerM
VTAPDHAAVELPPELTAEEVSRLSSSFAPPRWLRDLGVASWLLVGFILLLVGVAWLLGQAATIVNPLLAATIVAAVASPLVELLGRHRWPRALGAAVVLLAIVAVGVLVFLLVIGGITSQLPEIGGYASRAADKAAGWLKDAGVDASAADDAKTSVEASVPQIVSTLVHGTVSGIRGIASLVFGLSLMALSLFFLLKDGPGMRGWIETHAGVPPTVAKTITGELTRSLRGYFRGVTAVAAFNGIVVGLGALVLGVSLPGTIAVVSFVTAYIPFIGAFAAGTFAVVVALGSQGLTTALIMLVLFILANGLLQNLFQPVAFGAALDLNPLVVLVATIGAGSLFGMIGLVLAAPLVSAVVHIVHRRGAARAAGAAVPDLAGPS